MKTIDMRQKNLFLKLLFLVLMLTGVSSTWAVTSTYKIVNNKGEVVLHVKGTSNKPTLPDNAKSAFATNFRFYQYLEDAQLDASSGAAAAADKQLNPNLNLSYSGDVFVRYSYNAEANVKDQDNKTLRIDGTAAYNFTICNFAGNATTAPTPNGRYVWYNSSSTVHHTSLPSGDDYNEKILVKPYNTDATTVTESASDADKKTAPFQWRFIGQRNGYEGNQGLPDPYDIKIVSVADASKVLTAIYTRSYNEGPSNQQYVHLVYKAEDSDPQHIQRFFIRKLSNTIQIAVSAPLYLYLDGNNKNMWFVLNKEAAEPQYLTDANSYHEEQCLQALHMRIHSKQETASKIDAGSEKRSTLLFYRQETRKYVILDADGNKVAAANAAFDEMNDLQVPASIASALPGTTYQYWTNKDKTGELTTNVNLPDVVYVTYSYDKNNVGNQVKLDGSNSYKMLLNGNYVKYQVNSGDDSDVNIGTEDASDADEYAWKFKGDDPYHIQLTNDKTGAGYITGESTTSTITLHTGNKTAALKSNSEASGHTPSTYYLVKSPAYTNENRVYLLRASYVGEGATTAETDDDPNHYTWAYGGDASDWNESRPRLYSSAFIEDGDEAVQMQLNELLAKPGATYNIVDLSGKVVISAQVRSEILEVPASIKSPLATNFRYYNTLANAQTDDKSTGIVTTVTSGDEIYVKYDAGTEIKINVVDEGGKNVRYKDRGNQKDVIRNGTFYMLKFLHGENYYQEDGNNGITTVTKKAEVPYSNGDACMNIYDEAFADNTLKGGANTRTRIPWALIGGDPYRLKVSGYQNSHKLANGTSSDPIDGYNWYFTYFRTYYNTTLGKVVTTNVTDDPKVTTHTQFGNPEAVPTEYMVLGTKGKYKLVTTETINDGTTDEHRTVNNFEQYWKNYETIQNKLGGGVMPTDAELNARGWHKYPAWAYSKPLDGSAKEYDYQNHWFQTFEMGDEFELLEVSLNPSIVLLDNHGWEIFRHPMPTSKTSTDKKETVKTQFIKTYDSPMVKAYHWYKKGEKVTGYHKFRAYDPALAESGEEEYTSTSLADYPPEYATNPGDWYVTYEVKDEYKYLYNDNNGSPISAPCLIGNAGKWAKAGTGTIGSDNTVTVTGDATNLTITGTITDDMLWYMKPNPTIDTEMGYTGSAITYNSQQKGFDPYNIQIRHANQYFKNNATDAVFNEQEWSSTTDTGISISETAASYTATGSDNVTVHPTNFTFMALMDAHDNTRLVPRFDHLQAITDLASGTQKMAPWVYDTQDSTTVIIETKNDSVARQAIRIQPIQKYLFEIRDASSSTLVASSSSAFYAAPGTSLYTKLGDVNIPLPRDLIRSYCEYPAAYTSYTEGTNTYDNAITCYPLGDGTGISSSGVKIYVPYYPTQGLFSSVETPSWYNITFENKNQFLQVSDVANHTVAGGGVQTADASRWAFIGNPYNLQIINKADANTYFLTMNGSGDGTLMSDAGSNNHWTLVYNDNGNPIMRLTTQISSQDAYIKKNGAATKETTYPNGNDYKIFVTNLVTVTYHVWHGTFGTPSSWTEDFTESFDYAVNQLEDYPGLPETVALPLCEYKYFKTEADMKAGTPVGTGEQATIGYPTFSALYESLDATAKVSNMDIYLSYDVQYNDQSTPVKFFPDEATARASKEWSFLMQGVESTAIVYGTKNNDYGHENAQLGKTARTYGADVTGLTPAEQTFTQHTDVPVLGGFHFIRHTGEMDVDSSTGVMTIMKDTTAIGVLMGTRYIKSQDTDVEAYMMSPLNDFRRIAETYKDGMDTGFRENSWLWAFIGTPYKFEIVNREAEKDDSYMYLAQVEEKGISYVRLVNKNDTTGTKHYWTLEQLDNYGDAESQFSFHIKAYGEDKIISRAKATTTDMRVINTPPTSDIAYLKSTAFMAYPWNWSDNKYKTVTVNIYKGSVSGSPVLTKTFTPADRAFVAGDVIDGTDGHFYLPLEGTADGTSWKEKGVINHTMPYDGHKINIPYEIRRRACLYTVENGSFTVGSTDAAQTVNIYYTVPPAPYAPLFVPENELATFRALADDANFNGVKKSDYYYFMDVKNDLSQHAYVTDEQNGASSDTRFAASTPDHAKFFVVGDPYNMRLFNVYTDKLGGNAKNLARNSDGTTSMSSDAFYWEVVDPSSEGSHSYDATSSNVNYRLDYLGGNGTKANALRTKSTGDATKYYFGKDGKTYATSIYTSGGTPQLNKLAAFRDYPDSRHAANTSEVTISVMRPVSIKLSVYDKDEPTKLVTKNEQSDYYAVTERFKGVPSNLQRNYCKYTWVSTDATPSGTNNKLTDDGYFVMDEDIVSGRSLSLYAKYEETDDSPFCNLDENGNPVLKKNPSNSPWYNMNIGTRWAFFNSSRVGKRYEVKDATAFNANYVNNAIAANNLNNSELTFPYAGSSLPKATLPDRFHKGLHWALVGDPYNFQIRCQRDIIEFTGEGDARTQATDASGNYIYYPAYIKGAPTNDTSGTVVPSIAKEDEATWWTWIRERSSNRYFLSESWTRRTEVAATAAAAARKYGPRRLPIDYPQPDPSVNAPSGTLNFKIGDATFQDINKNQGVINYETGSYGIGDQMKLVSVNDVDANNECFDAIVTVYNKVNEPVATEGWTELVRENANGNGRIPAEVQRWGCTYHYWADETMTRYPFTAFNQKDENGNYLIQDKGTVYVTYDYDESLYSSETEYRWMDIFYNWDENPATRMAWINSPENSDTKDKDKAWCDQATQSTSRDQKWVMIGDPYKFILYNFNRKAEAGGDNAYYLYYDGTNIVNKNFTGADAFDDNNKKETKQGIYFTWKVDENNPSFGFTNDNKETYYKPVGLPESFYNFNGAGEYQVQTGYLAICDMTKTSLTDNDKLLGSILGYTTFDDTAAATDQYMTETASAAKRYLVMPLQRKAATVTFHLDPTGHTDSKRDWTTNPVFDYTTTDFGVDNTITLPWMMRRQYCDYQYYLITGDGEDPESSTKVDALSYTTGTASNAHRVASRDATYTDFWNDGATNLTALSSMEIPDAWNGKHVYIRVTYQPTAEFITSTNTGADDAAKAASVKWLNIANQEKGNMMQYTRSSKVTGSGRDNGENTTNDYLWAVEGDPYGFKLHNRYAVHGFNGSYNENWATVLTTDTINSTENYNYSPENNPHFTFDANGDPVKKSAITYGATGTANTFGTMIAPENETPKNYVYEAMTGNYVGAMLIHPVNACINVRHQNGMKYYGAFLFNGAATDYPVQLNYLQEWEAMRNVYANWKLQKPSAAQITSYFDRAGYVGALTSEVATANATLFGKVKGGTATDGEFDTAWALVHNPANLVQLTNGCYRLKAYSSFDNGQYTQEQLGGHYVSGYLHKLEQTYESGTPLHIYSKAGSSSAINSLTDLYGNEWADGISNTALLEIPDSEFDPSSVFYVTRNGNYVTMKTQGLVVNGSVMKAKEDAAENDTLFQMQDIGQTAFQMRTKASTIAETPAEDAYLSCNPNVTKYGLNIEGTELNVYQGAHDARIHDTKWLLEPVGTAATNAAGTTYQHPVKLNLTNVGEDMYYATVCFPYDVRVPTGAYAYSCTSSMIRGESSESSSGSTKYTLNIAMVAGTGAENSNRVLPAGVPAIIYVDGWDLEGKEVTDAGRVPFTIASSSDITLNAATLAALRNCPLKYQYLTQELPSTEVSDDDWVFVFSKSGKNVGFMRNSTLNYSGDTSNKFILHNRIYYVQPKNNVPSGRIALNFVDNLEVSDDPIVTGVQEIQNREDVVGNGDNTIYDLQGRKVTNVVRSGVYIVNGKKVVIHKK